MVYTVLGCVFLMIFGFEILWYEVFPPETSIDYKETMDNGISSENDSNIDTLNEQPEEEFFLFSRRSLIMFETFITTGCFLVLGGLCIWHGKLISRGETSIEAHINQSERKRLKELGDKPYRNPYDFGIWYNWCLFLGMIEGRGWKCVLFPSSHQPHGKILKHNFLFDKKKLVLCLSSNRQY